VINYDQSSKEYGKWQSFLIDENNRFQVLIPPRFGNGHFVLSDYAVFHYKQSTYYAPDSQFTIFWNDSRFNFDWPTTNPILSPRDSANT
jgi:dTDP-4-dehydrorhamnose 3,5-epimerase